MAELRKVLHELNRVLEVLTRETIIRQSWRVPDRRFGAHWSEVGRYGSHTAVS